MAEKRHEGGVSYHVPGKDYFEKRELRRHAGVFALWALGVGAVISGDFSGWNLGFNVGGWGNVISDDASGNAGMGRSDGSDSLGQAFALHALFS